MSVSEQWENGGDCEKCRRAKYCHKECKQHIARSKRLAMNMAGRFVSSFLNSLYFDDKAE